MSRATVKILVLLVVFIVAAPGRAAWQSTANVDLTSRFFNQEPRWSGQDRNSTQLSLSATADLRWRQDNSRASVIASIRWDETDEERSLFDLREAHWAHEAENYELLIGVNTVFWGVTESVHLVDIVNQTDAVGDIDGEDKLGQPMINLTMHRDWGQLGFYLMPWFRERSFAGVDGRLRTPIAVDSSGALFESSKEERHVDFAVRYSHYLGDYDIGLSLFKGTSREPRLLSDGSGQTLLPFYDQIEQFGLDLQYTGDAWLWKLEAIARDGFEDSFGAAVGGFEYTIYQLAGSAADLGLLMEYQYDERDDSEPVTLADNDVFAGLRLALNDVEDTTLLAGIAYDLDSGETFINVEADRRVGEASVVSAKLRVFTHIEAGDKGYPLVDDDYLQLRLSHYF